MPTLHGFDNRVVTDAIAQSGGKYRGIANINDAMSDAELAALDKAGIRGCRFAFLKRLGGVRDITRSSAPVDRVARHRLACRHLSRARNHPRVHADPEGAADPLCDRPHGHDRGRQGASTSRIQGAARAAKRDEKCWVKITGPERLSATGAPFHDSVPFAQKLIDDRARPRDLGHRLAASQRARSCRTTATSSTSIPLYAPDDRGRSTSCWSTIPCACSVLSGARCLTTALTDRQTATTPVQRRPAPQLWFQVLVAMVVGVALGHLWPDFATKMQPLGDAFIKAIRMLIAPIIFCTVVHGIARMADMARVGRVALKALIYFEVLTTLALIIGLVAVNLWQPGAGMNVDLAHVDTSARSRPTSRRATAGRHPVPAEDHPATLRRRLHRRQCPAGPVHRRCCAASR